MTTALAERPPVLDRETISQDADRDGIEVYCPDAQAWSTTRDLFCETCGATDHDLR